MSRRYSDYSCQTLQCSSATGVLPPRDGKSGALWNKNGKRRREHDDEGQLGTPKKHACLDTDHDNDQEESQQPATPMVIVSNPEREQGFAAGPGHIVFVDERGKSCPALCFNVGLFNTFKDMIEYSRDLQQSDKAIQKAELELERLMSSNNSVELVKAKEIVEEALKGQKEIEAGIPGLIEARQQYETLTQKHKSIKLQLEHNRWMAQMVIEQLLNSENLLDVPPSKPEKTVEDTRDRSWDPTPVPEKTADRSRSASPSPSAPGMEQPIKVRPEPTPRQRALHDLRFAAEEYEYRRGEFTFMQEDYSEVAANQRRYRQEQDPDRPASTTQTNFDLEVLQNKQHATRVMIEAKEKYDRMKKHAEDLGLGDILADPHACYYGEVYNEFAERTPTSPSACHVNRPQIEAWMASLPGFAVVGSQREGDAEVVDVDEWDAKSIEIFESVSQVDCNMYREKIDRWQEFSGRLRECKAGRL